MRRGHERGYRVAWVLLAEAALRVLWRSKESRGEFLEKPGKTEIFLSPFSDTLTGREAPLLLALRRITDHHLEALRAGKTGTAVTTPWTVSRSRTTTNMHTAPESGYRPAWVLLRGGAARVLWRSPGGDFFLLIEGGGGWIEGGKFFQKVALR